MNSRVALFLMLLILPPPFAGADDTVESTCYGTTKQGRLENGVKLPGRGLNFVSYSLILSGAGRTYVHSNVRTVVLNAYKTLESSHPDKIYVYGETGLSAGGPFKPHKTHQNGLSVDFMVPVVDGKGQSTPLPTNPFNKYGYGIAFDKKGRFEDLTIDFEAMAAHIKSLDVEAKKAGIGIWRVIFAPELQPYLYQTKNGDYIKKNILIPAKRSWVRHDDHYHVDFKVKCKPL